MPGEDWRTPIPGAVVTSTAGVAGVPGDICPQTFTPVFDRSEMSTEVLTGRTLPGNIPAFGYNFPSSVPPVSGGLSLNGTQTAATVMYVSKTTTEPADESLWLQYIDIDDSVAIHQSGEMGISRGYRVMGTVTDYGTYYGIPILWQEGQTDIPAGVVQFTFSLIPRPPQLWYDALGRNLYGKELYTLTDLIGITTDLHPDLADRILEVRGVNSVPRIGALTIDGRTPVNRPWQRARNHDVMAAASPEKPSRYHVRIQTESGGGRVLSDRMMFCTAVRHFIAHDEWTLDMTLDVAEWAGTL